MITSTEAATSSASSPTISAATSGAGSFFSGTITDSALGAAGPDFDPELASIILLLEEIPRLDSLVGRVGLGAMTGVESISSIF
jgi:hypothetical protein